MMPASRSTDPVFVAEVGLTLVLIGLGIYLFLRPAAEGLSDTEWWHWVVLAALFFGILGIHSWRKKRSSHRALHEAIDDDARKHAEPE